MTAAMTSPVVLAVGLAAETVLGDPPDQFVLLDGVSDQQQYAQRSLTVAGRWDPDLSAAVSSETVRTTPVESGAGRRMREDTTVVCLAYAGDGDPNPGPKRIVLARLLTDFGDALRNLHDIDGVSAIARLSDQQWTEVQDEQGVGVMVEFNVTVSTLP